MVEVDANTVKEAADAIRDLKNWLAVFAQEYNLAQEAQDKLHEEVDKIVVKLSQIEAKE